MYNIIVMDSVTLLTYYIHVIIIVPLSYVVETDYIYIYTCIIL